MVPKLKEKDVESLKVEQDKGNYIRYFKTAKEEKHKKSIEEELDQISPKIIQPPSNYQELEKAIINYKPADTSELGKLDVSIILKSKRESAFISLASVKSAS